MASTIGFDRYDQQAGPRLGGVFVAAVARSSPNRGADRIRLGRPHTEIIAANDRYGEYGGFNRAVCTQSGDMIPKPVRGVAGACVIRDAVDLVPFLCGHYLRAGFEHLAFVDDGSSDGTFELLSKIAKRTRRVSVRQVHNNSYNQPTLMTETANALIAAGYLIVVPFDADEFWNVEARKFEELSAFAPEAVFLGRWVNFIQTKTCRDASRFSLLNMVYRAPPTPVADLENTIGYRQSFVCFAETKIAIKARSDIEVDRGQHRLIRGPDYVCGPITEIFHLPLRSRQEIVKRGLNYEPRRAAVRTFAQMSWQSAFHRDVVMADKVDVVWAANSFDKDGQLDVYGQPLSLIPDSRLRRTLALAAWHLFVRFGLIAF